MSKKGYEINVINAEDIKNNLEGENKPNNENKPQELKTGLMIGGLITFFLAIGFLIFTLNYLFQTYSADDSAQKALTFVVFILSIGWISYIPGVICSIASLCMNPFVIKSSSMAQKIVGIVFTILAALLFLTFIAIAIYVSLLTNA